MFKLLSVIASAALLSMPVFAFEADRLTIKVGYSAGGGYDSNARLVADHIGRFLPGNPEVIVENVPGAGSLKLARLFLASGATDGSEIVMISSAMANAPVLNPDKVTFDPRELHWLFSAQNKPSYCMASKASGVTTLEEFLTSDIKIGATGKSSTTYLFPTAIKNALGADFEVITGFQGGTEIDLAMDRGEIQGRCGSSLANINRGGRLEHVTLVGEMAPSVVGEVDGVASIIAATDDPNTRQALSLIFASTAVHYPFMAHPDTSDETVEIFRQAFVKMSQDEAFLADNEARSIGVATTDGWKTQQLVDDFLSLDDAIKALAASFVK